jgi:hypothetical protein
MKAEKAILSEIENALTARFPSHQSKLVLFDSGAELLRTYHADRYFLIAFDGLNFWVDEPNEQDGFTSSFRYQFSDLGSARDGLFRMMSSSSQMRSDHSPSPPIRQ